MKDRKITNFFHKIMWKSIAIVITTFQCYNDDVRGINLWIKWKKIDLS